jgi:glutamyl-tRNA reductase
MTDPSLICLGISHRSAPLALREQLGCAPEHIYNAWMNGEVGDALPISEMALLSTCNRFELYLVLDSSPADPLSVGLELMSACDGQTPVGLEPHLYALSGPAAVEHLCRVAAGLESQVLGENQILGQVIQTYTTATEAGAAGPYLSALFQTAIRAGKRARAETAIGRNPVSLSSAAISAAHQVFPDLHNRSVLVLGAGEMAHLAVKSLLARGMSRIIVANRTVERARPLAALAGGQACSLDDLAAVLPEVDVVFSATAAPHFVIGRTIIEAALSPGRRLLLVDIALPRDIDPEVRHLPGVLVIDMDDLKHKVDDALILRQAEMPWVAAIIAEEQAWYDSRLRHLGVRPVITDMRQKAEEVRQRELARALRRLGPLDDTTSRQLDRFSRSLVNKLLHDPTIRLRDAADREEDVNVYLKTVRELFGLEGVE